MFKNPHNLWASNLLKSRRETRRTSVFDIHLHPFPLGAFEIAALASHLGASFNKFKLFMMATMKMLCLPSTFGCVPP